VANDILPASVWDLKHRPVSEPAGMVYVDAIDKWVDIYLASGTGANTLSVYGGTISDNRNWMDFVDDGAAVKKRLLKDYEFQVAAGGSNEGTNISADPVTTGGHNDKDARRMISNYGIEDMCGVIWQWLDEQSYRFGGAVNHTHQITVSGDPETVTSGNPSNDVAPGFSYKDQTGGKGQLYTQGTWGDVKLIAGGSWNHAMVCGSRGRYAGSCRWAAEPNVCGRFCSEGKK
jgi:formylglycine-generating enzyme required for sulfatase activity